MMFIPIEIFSHSKVKLVNENRRAVMKVISH